MQDLLCLAFPIDGAVTIRVTAPVYKAGAASDGVLQVDENPGAVTEQEVTVPPDGVSYTFDDLCTLAHYQTLLLGVILMLLIAKTILRCALTIVKWIYYNTFYHLF